ncbi:uncharacterized protein LOC122636053 isoform X2 [Vespula pensylvanica]|uniref:uncharacterized protein LOC122636053 isoform X2 n=1 Tax=Vespula pensylvanica TaxID=30213 RepID=UPI001CB9FC87|nr:uncharacterized protein LOC122636053 isoform X2 [Vespula pensylvanica]
MTEVSNRCMREFELQEEECLKDILFVDGNEADCDEDKNNLIEQVWWLSKPPVVKEQVPAISARQIQIVKERLSPMIKKPRGLTETLRDKIKENLKHQNRYITES